LGDLEPGARRGGQVAGPPEGQGGPPIGGPPGSPLPQAVPDAGPPHPDAGPWTLPNALTALRLLLAPVFLVLYAAGDVHHALPVFAVAAGTDLLDGLAARLLHQHSRLGEILDPVADKLLALCALAALAWAGRIPLWLPVLVVGRDAVLVAGGSLLYALGISVRLRVLPTRAGKYATFALAVLVVAELICDVEPVLLPRLVPWMAAVGLLVAFFVLVSLLQYAGVFARAVGGHLAPTESR
jgi:cardiolipin synthase